MTDKDLGVKIGSKEEIFWTAISKQCDEVIEKAKHEIEIQEHVKIKAEQRIKEEKENMKK